ncbi:MAG TPA: HAMP domain-containing histidine kinase [Mollicutes bacterium]|nr:HAMP domain-containing histidine kinase [Mollicutes bacterium]
MNILETLSLSCIFILFPLFCYFIFVINEQNLGRKTSNVLFDVALYSSLYLILKVETEYISVKVMFITIPLLIAYLKEKKILSIIFSLLIGLYYFYKFDINIILIILELSIYFVLFPILKKKSVNDFNTTSVFVVIKVIFTTLGLNLFEINNLNFVKKIMILPFAFYLMTHLIHYLMTKSEQIMSLHLTIKELEREKQVRNSLFKITHEIKNPIAVCKGYLEMFDPKNEDHLKRYIPIIRQEIERTLTIMTDFTNLTKLTVDKRKMDIMVLLNDVVEIASVLASEKKIEFEHNLSDDEVYIYGDYDRLKQVFINVIKNAMEAIPLNKKGLIKVNAKLTRGNITIIIEDNGVGMNKEVKDKMGEPFFTTKKNGTGLGIKLSNEIIEEHKGLLEYKSKPKAGTKAIVTLPLKKSL